MDFKDDDLLEDKSKSSSTEQLLDEVGYGEIFDIAKQIQELKKIKKQLQAKINFSKKSSKKSHNPEKDNCPEL